MNKSKFANILIKTRQIFHLIIAILILYISWGLYPDVISTVEEIVILINFLLVSGFHTLTHIKEKAPKDV